MHDDRLTYIYIQASLHSPRTGFIFSHHLMAGASFVSHWRNKHAHVDRHRHGRAWKT